MPRWVVMVAVGTAELCQHIGDAAPRATLARREGIVVVERTKVPFKKGSENFNLPGSRPRDEQRGQFRAEFDRHAQSRHDRRSALSRPLTGKRFQTRQFAE